MLKFISKINGKELFESQKFLLFSCSIIFLISIIMRSMMNISCDTAIYIDLGKKITEGKKYYYDFFEGNFPISFYIHALQYKIATTFQIHPVIFSEISSNLLALLSIFWAAKILKKTTIYDNKIHYNLLIIACFLSYFLRPNAFDEMETKTSFLLILLFPYLAYCFELKKSLDKKNLSFKGILMGLIPCFKPHYLILIIFVEALHFFKDRSLKFFFKLDKLFMALIGVLYLFLMLKLTPEFFEFIVPMWQKIYNPYRNLWTFLNGTSWFFANKMLLFSPIFLIFSKIKPTFNDKVLIIFFIAASFLLISEGLMSIDQLVIFYFALTICYLKLFCDLILLKKIDLSEHKLLVLFFLFLPLFNLDYLPIGFFGVFGISDIWWIFAILHPFFLYPKIKKIDQILISIFYLILFIFAICFLFYEKNAAYFIISAVSGLITLFILEKKRSKQQFLTASIATILASTSCLVYLYFNSLFIFEKKNQRYLDLSQKIAYNYKIYAPNTDDSALFLSKAIFQQFPFINYLDKQNNAKFHFNSAHAGIAKSQTFLMFDIKDKSNAFTFSYLIDDIKNQLRNKKNKIIFVDLGLDDVGDEKFSRCHIGFLEYYFLDPEFKKIFFENFKYADHFQVHEKRTSIKKSNHLIITSNFEVYVRKN